jgi:hypothetical protein
MILLRTRAEPEPWQAISIALPVAGQVGGEVVQVHHARGWARWRDIQVALFA